MRGNYNKIYKNKIKFQGNSMIKKFIILDKIIATIPMILYQHPMNIGGGKRLHRNCFQIKKNFMKLKRLSSKGKGQMWLLRMSTLKTL